MIKQSVAFALLEDVAEGDINVELLPARQAEARILTREAMVLCGRPWLESVFQQLDPTVQVDWLVAEGHWLKAGDVVCHVMGPVRALLTGERTALNFLQTLSGTATTVARYCQLLAGSDTQLLDTRKTLPGLRLAQKYAVACGGGTNHRMGLYDAFLLKENHIAAAGSIRQCLQDARALHPHRLLEIEVETLQEFEEALAEQPDIIMLDNFSLADLQTAVAKRDAARTLAGEAANSVRLEISGNVDQQSIQHYAALGVDYISVGALTKHVRAIDLSFRLL